MKSKLLFSFLLLIEILSAQNFKEYSQTPPFQGLIISSIIFTDVDGDNDQNLLITGTVFGGFLSKLYTNDGMGIFTEVSSSFKGAAFDSIAFTDIDNDNDKDVLVVGRNSSES